MMSQQPEFKEINQIMEEIDQRINVLNQDAESLLQQARK